MPKVVGFSSCFSKHLDKELDLADNLGTSFCLASELLGCLRAIDVHVTALNLQKNTQQVSTFECYGITCDNHVMEYFLNGILLYVMVCSS